jgi:hypothetical protein
MRVRRIVIVILGVWAFVGTAVASADTITFAGLTATITPGNPTVEGAFTYDTLTGDLFRDATLGNPAPEIQAVINQPFPTTGGGVLLVLRNDVAGGLFVWGAADIREIGVTASVTQISFEGLLNGVSQGIDAFSGLSAAYTTVNPSVLADVSIDELRVTLESRAQGEVPGVPDACVTFGFACAAQSVVDNLVLNPEAASVPEPGMLALLIAGALPLVAAAGRRRRSA